MRRFTCTEDGSNKFWEIDVEGTELVTRWGAVGSKGQTKRQPFPNAGDAGRALLGKVVEKLKKGYVEDPASAATWKEQGPVALAAMAASPATTAAAPATAAAPPKPKRKASSPPLSPLRFGFIDRSGQWVIAPEYESVGLFSEGLAPVQREGLWGYVDAKGAVVIEPRFSAAAPFRAGFANVTEGTAMKYVDRQGNAFDGWLGPVVDGMRRLSRGGYLQQGSEVPRDARWGYADAQGRIVVEPKYLALLDPEQSWDYGSGVVAGRLGDTTDGKEHWDFLDREGKVVVSRFQAGGVGQFSEGLAWGWDRDRTRFLVDTTGRRILVEGILRTRPFVEGRAAVEDATTGKWGFADHEGRAVVPRRYDDVLDFTEGRARVRLGDREGFVDADGREVIPLTWGRAGAFHEGRAVVSTATSYLEPKGAIDLDGRLVVPEDFSYLADFKGGVAVACPKSLPREDPRYGYLDREGRWVIPAEYPAIGAWGAIVTVNRGGVFVRGTITGGKWGFIDGKTGAEVIAPRFDAARARFGDDGLAGVGMRSDEDGAATAFPFRFYGTHPADWAEGANLGHVYEFLFVAPPADGTVAELRALFQRAFAKGAVEYGSVKFSERGGQLVVGERGRSNPERFFKGVQDAFTKVHALAALEQVVYLNARTTSDDAWERWSVERQPVPSGGADFGSMALYFRSAAPKAG